MRFNVSTIAACLAVLATQAPVHASSYLIDPNHTFVTFEIGHYKTSTNRGRFDKKQGSVEFDRFAKTGKIEMVIDTESISTGTPAFDRLLQSASVFDTTNHPTAKFVSNQLTFQDGKVSDVSGMLTLLGKTKPVVLKAINFNCYASPVLKREVCGGDFEAHLDRTEFGMDYGTTWGAPKDVRLSIQVEAIKQE